MNPDLVISTVAKDEETGTHYSNADESVTVIDTVTYTGLKKGKEYVMKGILMDHKTGSLFWIQKGRKYSDCRNSFLKQQKAVWK